MRRTFVSALVAAVFVVLSCALGNAQAFQMMPPDTPENCQARLQFAMKWLHDWPQLGRYRQADLELGPPKPSEQRVVFLGDSITDHWKIADYFPGKPYVNRGISAQTTPNLLLRFRQDVIALQAKLVIIYAGTNDIAGNTGPETIEEIGNNFASMVELARAHDIKVIIASVTPVSNYTPQSQKFFVDRPMDKIVELNQWLRSYADKNGIPYLDYFSSMVDEQGMLRRDLSEDGLHPNAAGYKIMAGLAEAAIEKALGTTPVPQK